MVRGDGVGILHSPLFVGVVGGPSLELERCLETEGLEFVRVSGGSIPQSVGILVLDLTNVTAREYQRISLRVPAASLAVIAAIGRTGLVDSESLVIADDLIVVPWHPGELAMRVNRIVGPRAPRNDRHYIIAGDLVIDPDRYDVYVSGKPVVLTFKEYELLKLLASNPGHVYTREVLLEQIWGYQYFGGTRTVDVHVRRLRSKIEDSTHTFIDTVWNVGYRLHT